MKPSLLFWLSIFTLSVLFFSLPELPKGTPTAQTPLLSPIALTAIPFAAASTSTTTPTSVPTESPSPTSTATLVTHSSTCPTPRGDVDETILYFDEVGLIPDVSYDSNIDIELDRLVTTVIDYLNRGGSTKNLEKILRSQSLDIVIEFADMDRDGIDEMFMVIDQSGIYGLRSIALFTCNDLKYRFVDWLFEAATNGSNEIITIDDLNQDGYVEYVIHETFCGSGCYEVLHIGQWKNRAERPEHWIIDVRPPARFWIRDLDGNGTKDIAFTGYRNLGPLVIPRKVLYVYQWDGREYQLQTETLEPPRLRTHYLEDASVALTNNDPTTAIQLYKAAIDMGSPTFARSEEQQNYDTYEIAFAYFRLILIHYAQHDWESVRTTQAEFAQRFLLDAPGHEFQPVLDRFVTVWETSNDINAACIEAESLLRKMRSNNSDFDINLVVISQSPIFGDTGAKWCPF